MKAFTPLRLIVGASALGALLLGVLLHRSFDVEFAWFVNGLDVPVTVRVDGSNLPVLSPGEHRETPLSVGVHHVLVSAPDDSTLEEGELYVRPASQHALIWNVVGAAPVYLQRHVYMRYARSRTVPDPVSYYAGRRVLDLEGVDYVFASAPGSISMDQHSNSVTRVQVGLAPNGWRTSLRLLEEARQFPELAKLGEALLRVQPRNEQALEATLSGLYFGDGPEAALGFLRRVKKAQPGWVPAYEAEVRLRRALGRPESARELLGRDAETLPEGDVDLALAALVEPPEQALAHLDAVVAHHPGGAALQAMRARRHFLAGRYEYALADYEAVLTPGQRVNQELLSEYLRCLVALGRAPEALKRAAKFGEQQAPGNWRFTVLYGHIAGFVPKSERPREVQHYVELANQGRTDRVLRVWMGVHLGEEQDAHALEDLPNEDVRKAVRVMAAAWKGPEEAWEAVHTASPRVLPMLDVTTSLLLAAEFERVGDAERAGQLFGTLALEVPLSRAELRTAVFEPEGEKVLSQLDPEWRAAVLLARARRLDTEGKDSRATYAAVARDDILQGVVSHALRQWNRPARGVSERKVLRLVNPDSMGRVLSEDAAK